MKTQNAKNQNHNNLLRVSIFVLLFFLSAGQISMADSSRSESEYQLESTKVTAQKRTQSVQDIPGTINVLSEFEIEDADIDSMEDLSSHVTGLEFYDFGTRRHSLTFMRGIKSIHAGEPATGYYVDGVNYGKSYMFDFPIFEIEQIEILKGPQGTLYGRNTMGGVINIHTKKPDNEIASSLSTIFGDYNLKEFKGFVRAPIVNDKLFFGISGISQERDGYMENDISANGEEGRYLDGKSGRMKLRYTLSDTLDVSFGLDGQKHDDGAFPFRMTNRSAFVQKGIFEADKNYHYSHDFEGSAENEFWGFSLNADYKTSAGTLTFITGYRNYDEDEYIDSDFSPLDMARMNYVIQEETFSQELRFASRESESPLQWLVGLYYFNVDSEKNQTNFYQSKMIGNPNNPFGSETGNRLMISDGNNEGAALFGQATYSVTKSIDLTAGLRWEYENAEMNSKTIDTPDNRNSVNSSSPLASNDFTALTPKLSMVWHATNHHMIYTTFSGGHRSGGFNDSAPNINIEYDEENSWLYEIGTKLNFPQKRVSINLSAFYTDIDDEQITLFNTENNTAYINNAGESHRIGFEGEIKYTPLDGLNLSAGLSVMEAEYDKYYDPATGMDYNGKTVFGVPDCTYNLSVQYRRPITLQWTFFGRIDLSGAGSRYFDDANTVKENPYELVNIKFGIEGEHWDCYLWSKNLFDRHYVIFENVSKGIAQDGTPQTIGVSLSYRF